MSPALLLQKLRWLIARCARILRRLFDAQSRRAQKFCRRRKAGPHRASAGINFNILEFSGVQGQPNADGCNAQARPERTTGSGAAFIDYDNDGWPDIFLVNGTTLEGFPKGQEPTSHLYHNNRNGTFTDATRKAGVALTGWGQGVCASDYNNDGWTDLYVTFWGHSVLLRNNGDGTFTDITKKAGL